MNGINSGWEDKKFSNLLRSLTKRLRFLSKIFTFPKIFAFPCKTLAFSRKDIAFPRKRFAFPCKYICVLSQNLLCSLVKRVFSRERYLLRAFVGTASHERSWMYAAALEKGCQSFAVGYHILKSFFII